MPLCGAALVTSGWPQLEARFTWLASRVSDGASFESEVVAGASGDLAYLVAVEHTTAAIDDPPSALRVTTLFRREAVEWQIAHRHAAPLPHSGSAQDRLVALRGTDPAR